MCLKPVRVRVRLATVSEGQPVFVSVPCGRCYQCLQRKQNDYYIRCYYESLSTMEKEGYILLDTLTYSDEFVPHVRDYVPFSIPSECDFTCFNPDHFRLFISAIRSRLKRDGFDVSQHLRYFLCSEYGTDPRCSHRPHYHIMFFVTDPNISPLYLSDLVCHYWKYGRTDGVEYRGSNYVLGHCTFGLKYNNDLNAALRSSGYVSKYVTKDSEFNKVLYERFTLLESHLSIVSPDFDVAALKRNMRQYLRISKGFGMSLLSYNSIEDIIKDNGVYLSDSKKVKRFYPLPSYYRRKLFFDTVRYVDNVGKSHLFYERNELGDAYVKRAFDLSVKYFVARVKNAILSFKNVGSAYFVDRLNTISDCCNDEFYERLSLYCLFVRGRYFTDYYDHVQDLDPTFLKVSVLMRNKFDFVEVVKHYKDVDYIGEIKCLSDGRRQGFEIHPRQAAIDDYVRQDLFSNLNLSAYEFISDLNPFTCPEFERFESFLRVYEVLSYYFNVELDTSFQHVNLLKRKMKKFKYNGIK